jgi:dolichol-phosphate mannosyltransferase
MTATTVRDLAPASRNAVSIVVPTFNEAANASALLRRIHDSVVVDGRLDCEVIFVDDGTDDLPVLVDREAHRYGMPIHVHRRDHASGGLGGAVVHGMRVASHDLVVVMDGDLQHPPEHLPALVAAAYDGEGHDLVVASRYAAGGEHDGLDGGLRRFVSKASGAVSKALFPRRLRAVTDPMSGFFAARRSSLDLAALRPSGFKILLEIVARSPRLRVREIPFVFERRIAGESHAGVVEGLRFLRQLLRLRLANRLAAFLLVGLSGVVPNLAAVYALTSVGLGSAVAAVVGVQVAIVWNFVGAELFVWRDRRSRRAIHRFAAFALAGETDLLRVPFVVLIVDVLHFRHAVLATLLTLCGAFLMRFGLASKLVYRHPPAESG